jgi:hypothetical protein
MKKLLAATALLAASATANAAIYEGTLTEHLLGRAGDPPSAQLINPAPSGHPSWGGMDTGNIPAPIFTYDTETNILSSSGVLHIRSQTSPLSGGRLFDRYITDLTIDLNTGDTSGTTAYLCENTKSSGTKAGGFGEGVGANMCGNYLLGDNFTDDSTLTYSGLSATRVLGGDDSPAGAVQSIADYAMFLASFDAETGILVIQTADWDPESSAGTQLTFSLSPVVPVPAAVWLFGSALGLMGLARRRLAA